MIIDMHVHTMYSKHWLWGFDSLNMPRELIKIAKKKGLNGLAITDHNNVKGSLITKNVAKRFPDFKIITGSEITTNEGELLAFEIKKDVPPFLSLDETIEKIHDLGGIAVAPHPYGSYIFRKCLEEKSVKADAIEVFNPTLLKYANSKALKLAKMNKMPMTAGSDAHGLRELGNGAIECQEDPIRAILKRKVKIISGKTGVRDLTNLIARKFFRSLEWRLLGQRGNYI